MKKLIALFLALMMLSAMAAFAVETIDLTTYTDEELEALELQVAKERHSRAAVAEPESPASDFRYASNGKEVRIIKYLGKGGAVVIPDEIEGLPVTQIHMQAFYQNSDITSVKLPARLVSLGEEAFYRCRNLKGVIVLPETVRLLDERVFCDTQISGIVIQSECSLDHAALCSDTMEFVYCREGANLTLKSQLVFDEHTTTIVLPKTATKMKTALTDIYPYSYLTVYCPAGSAAERYCQDNFLVYNTADYEAMVAYYEALYPAE